jgi:hypothetical protein
LQKSEKFIKAFSLTAGFAERKQRAREKVLRGKFFAQS